MEGREAFLRLMEKNHGSYNCCFKSACVMALKWSPGAVFISRTCFILILARTCQHYQTRGAIVGLWWNSLSHRFLSDLREPECGRRAQKTKLRLYLVLPPWSLLLGWEAEEGWAHDLCEDAFSGVFCSIKNCPWSRSLKTVLLHWAAVGINTLRWGIKIQR